ncbi:T9SS type A sorting domain-containing protein [Croceiramulus getboli]|nr:T9SS type A sorting domain-containing protein [Flavobacteriaceae bacterium YJPT1-3]
MKQFLLFFFIFSSYLGFAQCVDPLLTDFECDPPSHPFSGGVVVENIDNPFPTGINTSARVGRATDNGMEGFDALIVEYGSPIDLTTNPIFHMKVYTELTAPIPLVAKVEGGTTPLEIAAEIAVSDQWSEYTFDFSSVADSGNTRLVVFFNFGATDGTTTDLYYIDDLFFGPAPTRCEDPILTDFECDLPSHPFSGGVVVENIDNPFPTGINTSSRVGRATDNGTEGFDALIVEYGSPIDLTTNPIFHMKVYTELTVPIPLVAKVEGGTTPLEIAAEIAVSDQWSEYTFDFSSVADQGNTRLVVFFNFGATDGTTTDLYYIDDLFFGPAPTRCEDPILTDFECDLPSHPFSGGVVVENIDNPFPTGINTSARVGRATDNGTEGFDALIVEYGSPIDLTTNPIFHMKVYTELTAPIPLVAKVEGGTTPLEIAAEIAVSDQWSEYTFDFSSVADSGNTRLVVFFNFGATDGTTTDLYYIDDLFFGPAPTRCEDPILTDFECDLPSHPFSGGVVVENIDNPFPTGINTSARVGRATDNGTEAFDALISDYGMPIDLTTNPVFHIKVYTEGTTPIPFAVKVEGGTTPLEIGTEIDVSNQWKEYTFDFSSVADQGNTTLVLFFNAGATDGTTTDLYYIDDLFFGPAPTRCEDPVLTDFECDLPSHPFSGGVVVENIDNPFAGGINTSARVGRATDNGTEGFDALISDYGMPIDLTTNPVFHIKVYTEGATPIPFAVKVEGGTTPLEIGTEIDVSNDWKEYTFDFSSVADQGNTTLVLFFNAGATDGTTTDLYYIDDLFFGPAPSRCEDPILTDFECDLPSHPFSGGVVVENIDNPFAGGINTSSRVGRATDNGTEAFDALISDYGMPIDLTTNPVFHIKVYTEGATPIPFAVKVEGGTTPLEIGTEIDVSNQWKEYTFDFSSVADQGNTTLVLFFNAGATDGTTTDLYYIDDLFFGPAPTRCEDPILTDFECDLPSHPFSGGVVVENIDNPFAGGINTSSRVGRATDNGTEAFDALISDYGMPIDLTTNPVFHIKVYTEGTTPIPFAVKVEGGTTPLEIGTEIDVSNQWKEYTFDFSSVADQGNTTLVLFFNAGATDGTTTDLYYIDDLFFGPAPSRCEDPILTDFECDLPSHPFSGGVVVENIDNPFAGGINTSARVGRATDNGTEGFDALISDYGMPIDLTTNPVFHIKVYTEGTTPIPFAVKVEGGTTPLEIGTEIDVSNDWKEYTFDFSSVADQGNTTLVLFFNAGATDGTTTDLYYIDDLFFGPAPSRCEDPILTDFECDLPSHPFSGGVVVENIDNPFPTGINTSARVGRATDNGTEGFDALISDYGMPIDLTTNPVFHIKVYTEGTTPIPFAVKVEGGTTPLEIGTEIDVSNQWKEYTFDFSSVADQGNTTLVLFFNAGATDGTTTDLYYIDDLFFGPAPSRCEDPILTDFECDLPSHPFSGGVVVENIDNPFAGGINTSSRVGRATDNGTEAFDALISDYGMPIDLTTNPVFHIKVYTEGTTPIPFAVKVEGGTTPLEIGTEIDVSNQWKEYTFDFSSVADQGNTTLVLFFNAGATDGTTTDLYYIDDLFFGPAPTRCEDPILTDFECDLPSHPISGAITRVPNPFIEGINLSENVGEYVDDGSDPFDNVSFAYEMPIDLTVYNILKLKVYTTQTTNLLVKLENGTSVPAERGNIGDNGDNIDVTNAWTEYEFDFSDQAGENHQRLVLFFNAGNTQADPETFYIDDLRWEASTLAIEDVEQENQLYVYPNPVVDQIKIFTTTEIETFEIYDLTGRVILQGGKTAESSVNVIDASSLNSGIYLLTMKTASFTKTIRILKR